PRARRRRHGAPYKGISYPHDDSPAKYKAALAGIIKGSPKRVEDAIEAINPYQGGNDDRWALQELDIDRQAPSAAHGRLQDLSGQGRFPLSRMPVPSATADTSRSLLTHFPALPRSRSGAL